MQCCISHYRGFTIVDENKWGNLRERERREKRQSETERERERDRQIEEEVPTRYRC